MSNQQHDHLRAAETGFRDASLALTARGRRLTELLDQLPEALERAGLCPVERAQYSALLDALRVEVGICQEVAA